MMVCGSTCKHSHCGATKVGLGDAGYTCYRHCIYNFKGHNREDMQADDYLIIPCIFIMMFDFIYNSNEENRLQFKNQSYRWSSCIYGMSRTVKMSPRSDLYSISVKSHTSCRQLVSSAHPFTVRVCRYLYRHRQNRHIGTFFQYRHIGYRQTFLVPILPIFKYRHSEPYRRNIG